MEKIKSPHLEVREDWLNQLKEDPILPDLPIIDTHHHLWDVGFGKYYVEELLDDISFFMKNFKSQLKREGEFFKQIDKKIDNINYDFYGFENKEPIWGDNFYKALVNSKMGLNLSRGLPTKYYSSNRIASLMGNGLLTFIYKC